MGDAGGEASNNTISGIVWVIINLQDMHIISNIDFSILKNVKVKL